MSVVNCMESNRLSFRPPRLSDAGPILSILGDKESRPHTFNIGSLRESRRYIAANECQRRKLGYALWLVVEKESGRIVGLGGLYDDPFDVGWGPEIAYHFARDVRGKGYATELTFQALDVACDLDLPEVRAFVHPENTSSQRVLEKAGFIQDRFIPDMNRNLYAWRPAV